MRQLCYATLLLSVLLFTPYRPAHAAATNWCGAYYEKDNIGYLRIALSDFHSDHNNCTIDEYRYRALSYGTANIALGFTKNRSMVANWRKFDNHILEVRGKLERGTITSPRFVRDMGI